MDALRPLALLVGRVFIAAIFIYDATVMIRAWGPAIAYMERFGLPASPLLLPLTVILQLGGGALIVLGLLTRPTALAFAGYSLLTALIFHNNLASSGEALHFGKDIAIAGGFLFLMASGAGDWSLDARLGGRK